MNKLKTYFVNLWAAIRGKGSATTQDGPGPFRPTK